MTQEMRETRPRGPRPVHVGSGCSRHRRLAPVVQDSDRARRHAVLEEVEPDPGPLGPEYPRSRRRASRARARLDPPRMRGRKGEMRRGAEAEARARRRRRWPPSRRSARPARRPARALGRRRRARRNLAERDEVEAAWRAVRRWSTSRTVTELPSIRRSASTRVWRAWSKVTWAGWLERAHEEKRVMSICALQAAGGGIRRHPEAKRRDLRAIALAEHVVRPLVLAFRPANDCRAVVPLGVLLQPVRREVQRGEARSSTAWPQEA